MVATAVSSFGTPDILVCCAGITHVAEQHGFLELTDEEWDAVLGINLRGTFLCTQIVARRLVASGRPGSLITVSSIGASRPSFGVPAYHASKGGVTGLTQALAVNLAPHRIRANGLAPGYILTDMTREGLDDPELYRVLLSRITLYRMGDPGELAGAAIFLASDESAYMTGQLLHIDGGALVHGWVPAGSPGVTPQAG
jgi:NAD(P)-dependent dehydrogenase (short-subunit alcohol dehydrogenase family)